MKKTTLLLIILLYPGVVLSADYDEIGLIYGELIAIYHTSNAVKAKCSNFSQLDDININQIHSQLSDVVPSDVFSKFQREVDSDRISQVVGSTIDTMFEQIKSCNDGRVDDLANSALREYESGLSRISGFPKVN